MPDRKGLNRGGQEGPAFPLAILIQCTEAGHIPGAQLEGTAATVARIGVLRGGPGCPVLIVIPLLQLHKGTLEPRGESQAWDAPLSANSRGPKHESLLQHQVSAAAWDPARPDQISNWITGPASGSLGAQAQGLAEGELGL